MTYKFEKIEMGSFTVYRTVARVGSVHRKRFADGVTPANQGTLNLYAGKFLFSIPSIEFEQRLDAGQSSLDLSIEAFPSGGICEERPLEDGAVRYCVSPTVSQKWRRTVIDLDGEHSLAKGSLVFPVSGDVAADGIAMRLHEPASAENVSGSGRAILVEVI